mgnify:CR=1 FL=1|tara:strand:- start:429792 stop:430190 length:399 start_codon:yes stop_codon:yes gene_type:complete
MKGLFMSLANQECIPCKAGMPPLTPEETSEYLAQLGNGWEVTTEGKRLFKSYKFRNFKRALKYVNALAEIAEDVGHHPNIHFTWGLVELEIWTHAIDGLAGADFILAAKADQAFDEMPFNKAKEAKKETASA